MFHKQVIVLAGQNSWLVRVDHSKESRSSMSLKPFVINSHGNIVFPGNFFPELDFSVFKTLKQFAAVIRRDFGEKSFTDAEIAGRLQAGEYKNRYDLCRDLALNRLWVNRYTLTMYEKRPTRWGDLPRHRSDVFLPVYKPRDDSAVITAIQAGYWELPSAWDEDLEDRAFSILLNVFRNKLSSGGELRPIRPTVAEALEVPKARTRVLTSYDADYLRYTYNDVLDCLHPVPELEALMRQCMILHNQYPWDPSTSTQTELSQLKDDDYVVAFHPRSQEVMRFIQRVKTDTEWGPRVRQARRAPDTLALSEPVKPYPAVEVNKRFAILPRIEAYCGLRRRDCVHQRGPHSQPRLLLVAHVGGRNQRENGHRTTLLHRARPGRDGSARRQERPYQIRATACRNRSRVVLQLHQHQANSIGCDLAFGRTGIIADP